MARKPTGRPNGRPPREFEEKLFENLCRIHCTVDEIEAVLNTHSTVLDGWCQRHYGETFQTSYKRLRSGGKASLRRTQFKLAEKNAAMAIWLGKQELGQKDKQEIEHTTINDENQIIQKDPKEINIRY